MEHFLSQDPRSYSLYFDLKIWFRTFRELSRNGPQHSHGLSKNDWLLPTSLIPNHKAKQSNKMVLMRDLFIFTKFTKMWVEKVRKCRRFEGAPPPSVVLVLIKGSADRTSATENLTSPPFKRFESWFFTTRSVWELKLELKREDRLKT